MMLQCNMTSKEYWLPYKDGGRDMVLSKRRKNVLVEKKKKIFSYSLISGGLK